MTRLTYGGGVCAAPGCDKRTPRNMLMCGSDWRRVPLVLQRRVNRAFWRFRDGECGIDELREAQQAAVDALQIPKVAPA